MSQLIPLQVGLIVLGAAVIITGLFLHDVLLITIGGLMTAIAITGLGLALRSRAREKN